MDVDRSGIFKRSIKGDQATFIGYVRVIKESRPIELLLISSSESQKFKGSISIPKGNPEENPKNKIMKSLGCRYAEKDSFQEAIY